ncbi:VOC family protein [Roseomonas sp. F4]
MPNPHGSFIWYELLTKDTDAAARFYGPILGWTAAPFAGSEMGYTVFSHGTQGIGGMMAAPPGVAPVWLGYIVVDDVDATVARLAAAGGAVQMPARDIPKVGRIAMVADRDGAPFYVMRGASDQPSQSYDADAVGHCAWNELSARDAEGAVDFYATHFGWQRGEPLPMGPMGTYQLMELGGRAFGAIAPAQGGMPPIWRFYFRVPRIQAALRQVVELGGTVAMGPMDVPGGDQILIGTDPQGAEFALVGKPD